MIILVNALTNINNKHLIQYLFIFVNAIIFYEH